MKRSIYISALSAAAMALMGAGLVTPANGQGGGPPGLQKQAIEAMKANNWPAALKAIDQCITTFGAKAKDFGIGDEFGWFYFQKGVCLLQMKNYDEAIKAFTECYTKYPGEKNEFVKVALFRVGEAQFMKQDYPAAIEAFQKFTRERRPRGPETRINMGQLYSMMAQCYFLQGPAGLEKGIDSFGKCIINRYKGQGIADHYIMQAFTTMVNSCMDQGKPQVAVDFLEKYPSVLNLGTVRIAPFGPELLQLASKVYEKMIEAQKAGNEALANSYARLAIILEAAVPNLNETLAENDKLVKKLGPLPGIVDSSAIYDKKVLSSVQKIYSKLKTENKPLEGYAMMAIANMHLNYGSIRTANKALELLEDRYTKLDKREDNLFQYAITTWTLGDMAKGGELVDRHSKAFPTSKYADVLSTMSLEKLLKDKNYEGCLEQSKKVMAANADDKTNKFYILASYCEGASLYYLKRYSEAIPSLDAYIKANPTAANTAQAMYFLGSSYTSLGRWDDALRVFGDYIKKYPIPQNNPLLPSVYYERAYVYLQRNQEGDELKALDDAKHITENFPGTSVYPMAFVLMGNVYTANPDTIDKATEVYLKGYEEGKAAKMKNVISEALYNLAANAQASSKPEDKAKVGEYAELFWKEADSKGNPFALMLAVTNLSANKDGGAGFEPALQKLREIIVREGDKDVVDVRVEQAVGSYTKLYLDTMEALGKPLTLDQVRNHFYKFPGVKDENVSLRTVLRTAVIGVYQDQLKALKPDQSELKAQLEGNVNVFFRELVSDFKPADLTPYTLLKLGSHLAQTGQPLVALPYFDEILKRKKGFEKEATYGKAIALGRSKDPGRIDEAIKMMNGALEDERKKKNPDTKSMEEAQYYLVLFQMDKGDFNQVIEQAQVYLDNKAYRKNSIEMRYNQGLAYNKIGKLDEALGAFMGIVNSNKGQIRWSAPALEQAMIVLWNRNKPQEGTKISDRYLAVKQGENYLKLTKPNFTRMSLPERDAWRKVEDLTKRYNADAGVMAEIKAAEERAAAIRASQGRK